MVVRFSEITVFILFNIFIFCRILQHMCVQYLFELVEFLLRFIYLIYIVVCIVFCVRRVCDCSRIDLFTSVLAFVLVLLYFLIDWSKRNFADLTIYENIYQNNCAISGPPNLFMSVLF